MLSAFIDPPERALVLSVDEKSQIQALDRTQPGLPMKKGRCGTMTHDLYGDLSVKDLNLAMHLCCCISVLGVRDDLRALANWARSIAPHTCIR